jgi:hypothetical protein
VKAKRVRRVDSVAPSEALCGGLGVGCSPSGVRGRAPRANRAPGKTATGEVTRAKTTSESRKYKLTGPELKRPATWIHVEPAPYRITQTILKLNDPAKAEPKHAEPLNDETKQHHNHPADEM